jgi:hypothetical protein
MDAMERKTEEAAAAHRRERNLAAEPTYINCPFSQKDEAKAIGAWCVRVGPATRSVLFSLPLARGRAHVQLSKQSATDCFGGTGGIRREGGGLSRQARSSRPSRAGCPSPHPAGWHDVSAVTRLCGGAAVSDCGVSTPSANPLENVAACYRIVFGSCNHNLRYRVRRIRVSCSKSFIHF